MKNFLNIADATVLALHAAVLLAKHTDRPLTTQQLAQTMPLGVSHRSDVITELMDSAALAVGSPTLNQQMFPTVADCLTYLKGLKKKNLLGLAFGSYGWTPDGVKAVNETLAAMISTPNNFYPSGHPNVFEMPISDLQGAESH